MDAVQNLGGSNRKRDMPLFYVAGSLFHFAHIPRCGGGSIEAYLGERFGALGFLDRRFLSVPDIERWSRSSPQHLEEAALSRLIPNAWIRESFTLVRHPEDRIRSVFLFQRDVEKLIARDTPFADWLSILPKKRSVDPHWLDNHPRPMTELVSDETKVFYLECGMGPIIDWLDEVEGIKRGERTIGKHNEYSAYIVRMAQRGIEPGPPPMITAAARSKIYEIYAADFERFGYTPRFGDDEPPAEPSTSVTAG